MLERRVENSQGPSPANSLHRHAELCRQVRGGKEAVLARRQDRQDSGQRPGHLQVDGPGAFVPGVELTFRGDGIAIPLATRLDVPAITPVADGRSLLATSGRLAS
jgi:hypothetical protein